MRKSFIKRQGLTEYLIVLALLAIALILIVAVFGSNQKSLNQASNYTFKDGRDYRELAEAGASDSTEDNGRHRTGLLKGEDKTSNSASTQAAMAYKTAQDQKKVSAVENLSVKGANTPQSQQALKEYYSTFDSPNQLSQKKSFDQWYASGGSESSTYQQQEASVQSQTSSYVTSTTGAGSSSGAGASSGSSSGAGAGSSSGAGAGSGSSSGAGAGSSSGAGFSPSAGSKMSLLGGARGGSTSSMMSFLPKAGGSYLLSGLNMATSSFLPTLKEKGLSSIKEAGIAFAEKKAADLLKGVAIKGKGLLNASQGLLEKGRELVEKGRTTTKDLVQSGRDQVDGLIGKGREKIDDLIGKGRESVDGLLGKGRGAIDGAVDKGMGKIGGLLDKLESSLGKTLGKPIAGFLRGKADELLGKAKGKLDGALDKVEGKITGVLDAIQGKIKSGVDKAQSALGGLLDKVQGAVGGLVDKVFDQANSLLDKIKNSKIYTSIFGKEYSLSEADRTDLADVFGSSLDVDKLVVHRGGFPEKIQKLFQDSGVGITLGNHVYLPDDSTHFNPDGTLTHYGRIVLIHEAAHVWQHQNEPAPGTGYAYLVKAALAQITATIKTGDRGGAYTWEPSADSGVPFEKLNPEQQAHVVEEAYAAGLHNDPSARLVIGGTDYTDYAREALRKVRAGEGAPSF